MRLITVLLTVLFSAPLVSGSAWAKDPNVVLIVIDTLRNDHLPFYGYKKNTAPYMSKLAKQGVVFEHCSSTSSWTAPGTASVITSLHPSQHGVEMGLQATRRMKRVDQDYKLNRVPESVETIAETMKKAGYSTFGIADNPNITARQGYAQGFDRFESYHYETADKVNSVLSSWKDEILKSEKSFIYLQYMDPHDPYEKREPWYEAPEKKQDIGKAAYDSEIAYVDDAIRKMSKVFGWEKNTIVVVTSDHGEEFRDHGQIGHGKNLYREVLEVPLFFYYPEGGIVGKRVSAPVSVLDVVPTLRAMLKLPPDPNNEGENLLARLSDEAPLHQRPVFASLWKQRPTGEEKTVSSIIHENWKLVTSEVVSWKDDSTIKPKRIELFDLSKDPLEQVELSKKNPEKVTKLEQLMSQEQAALKKYQREAVSFKLEDVLVHKEH